MYPKERYKWYPDGTTQKIEEKLKPSSKFKLRID